MERFVIGAAILAAVAIAAGGYFGHSISDGKGAWEFKIDGGGEGAGAPAPAAAQGSGTPSTVPSARYAATAVEIRGAVATVIVIPEDRTDVSVEIANPGVLPTPTVAVAGDRVLIDGGLRRRIGGCRGAGDAFSVDVRGTGAVEAARAPVVTLRTPKAVRLSTDGAVRTRVGPAASAELALAGCGDTTLGDVAGKLELKASGTGAVAAGAAGEAEVSLAGSGDAALGAVSGMLDVEIAGSGGVTIARATGPVDVSVAGSGDVAIGGGPMGDADIAVAGSGDVTLEGDAQTVEVSIAGSGDVVVRGAAAALKASIVGSGDVTVASVRGNVERAVIGSGEVRVGGR